MAQPEATSLLFHGAVITPETIHYARFIPDALVFVQGGTIQWMEEAVTTDNLREDILVSKGLQGVPAIKLRRGQFLMPGLIDTHTHAPQFPNIGRGGQYELLGWLSNLTFPTESKFGDRQFAEKVYTKVVRKLLDCGTTTCCYFSSAHVVGTEVLAKAVVACGQRAFIGNCNMDRNAPESYLKGLDASKSIEHSRQIISYIASLKSPLVRPILTPRFAITCTSELLGGLGNLVGEFSTTTTPLLVQTHVSENKAEVEFTRSLYPSSASYTHIYDDHGILGPATILAHGCQLTEEETALIKKTGAGLSHCPTSNFNLRSGIARVGEWLDKGIKVGLGTDVSGGYSPSLITAIQHASIASKIVASQAISTPKEIVQLNGPDGQSTTYGFTGRPLPNTALLHMATLGGAQLCSIEDLTGSISPGKAFDALLINLLPETGNPNVWWDDESMDGAPDRNAELEDFLEKFFFCGDDRNVSAVYVHGRLVGGQKFDTTTRVIHM
ncbi:guanine deaminase [Hysterangium stoloniferum]|nr:guanine deaminase [Hysterangium stoloniferum]